MLWKKLDYNGDGSVSFLEFVRAFHSAKRDSISRVAAPPNFNRRRTMHVGGAGVPPPPPSRLPNVAETGPRAIELIIDTHASAPHLHDGPARAIEQVIAGLRTD